MDVADFCAHCGSKEKLTFSKDGRLICEQCRADGKDRPPEHAPPRVPVSIWQRQLERAKRKKAA